MSHAPRTNVLADLIHATNIEKTWDGLTLERKRAVVSALFTVTIGKGRTGGNTRHGPMPFDLNTISVTERDPE